MALHAPVAKPSAVACQIADRLTPFLGSFNAEVWVRTVAKRDLSIGSEQILLSHLPAVLAGLRPSLNTFIGRAAAAELLEQIAREVR